ncbi:MAG TPA: GTP cyclohydrolase I [Streptosporangiaceae bacterium]|nr:GTP cyclohydrolase I [Streptosporangiaceae bacterium]
MPNELTLGPPARAVPDAATGLSDRAVELPDPTADWYDPTAGTNQPPGPDLVAAQRAAADFLTALGVRLDDDGLRDTPARMARAYAELFAPRPMRLTTFPNSDGYKELVVARGIPFRAVCEHHLLPFCGVAHVGYLPGERILGLSKLARLVEHFAARPQSQERLTQQVADCLSDSLQPCGAGVVLEAEHTCMTVRGVRAIGATTITSALVGTLRGKRARREFFALAGVHA